jgi:hypothetical protein
VEFFLRVMSKIVETLHDERTGMVAQLANQQAAASSGWGAAWERCGTRRRQVDLGGAARAEQ